MSRTRLLALLGLVALPLPARATDFTWNGSTSVGGVASWLAGTNYFPGPPTAAPPTSPGAADTVQFNSFSTGSVNTALNSNFSILGLGVSNVPGTSGANTVLIAPGTPAGVLTLGASGIDMTAALQDLTISAGLNAGASQNWSVVSPRTLNLTGAVTATGKTLSLNTTPGQNVPSIATFGTIALTNGGNTFAGSSLTLRGGVLRLDVATALGTGSNGLTLAPLTPDNIESDTIYRAVLGLSNVSVGSSPLLTMAAVTPTQRATLRSLSGTGSAWTAGVTLSGQAAGVNEFDAFNASTLTVSTGAVTAASGYAGTLRLGSSGTGTGTGVVSSQVSIGGGTLAKEDAGSLWTISSSGNTWGTTAIRAGTLRVGTTNALATAAGVTLGTATTGTVGTLDLSGFDQTVTGLTTVSSDALVNPAGNIVGIGTTTPAGPGVVSTLTYNGSAAQTFEGTLANGTGAANGRTLALSVVAGDLTLGAANTYSGVTNVGAVGGSTAAALRLATVTGTAGGGFTNYGSLAFSPIISLNNTVAVFGTVGLTGGTNYDATNTRFALVTGQLLLGLGTVTGNGVTVPATAAVRGGLPGNVATPLTVAGGLRLVGGTPGSANGQFVVDLNHTSTTSGVSVGRLAVTGGSNTLNFVTTGGPVVIRLANSDGVVFGQSYSFIVATAVGGFQRTTGAGTTPVTTSYTYGTDFTLSQDAPLFTGYIGTPTLSVSGTTLTLGFTPVPEPATVGLLAVAGLGAVRLVRRRILAG